MTVGYSCRHCTWVGLRVEGSTKPCPKCGSPIARSNEKLPRLHLCGHEVVEGTWPERQCGPCERAERSPPIPGYTYEMTTFDGQRLRFSIPKHLRRK